MSFKDFIDQKKVKKTIPDKMKEASLFQNSSNFIDSLDKIEVSEVNSVLIMSSYYEALRMCVEALALQEGFNVYSHEALVSFIEEVLGDFPSSTKFDRFRKIRNGINYYGDNISIIEVKENSRVIKQMILDYKKLYTKKDSKTR